MKMYALQSFDPATSVFGEPEALLTDRRMADHLEEIENGQQPIEGPWVGPYWVITIREVSI